MERLKSGSEFRRRIERVRGLMSDAGLRCLLVSAPKNVLYLTGAETGRVLLTDDSAFLWVRDLYLGVYGDLFSLRGYPFDVEAYESGVIKNRMRARRVRKAGVDDMGVSRFESLRRDLSGVRLSVLDAVERARMVKTPAEIEALRESAKIAVRGMEKAYAVVRAGVKETDALAEVEYEIRRRGSQTPPFTEGMLLSSGPASGNVHARAENRRMRAGSAAVVDLGANFQGYYSDMTRTIPVGKAKRGLSELLGFVRDLELEVIDMLEPGVCAGAVHAFAEKRLEERGYRFYHSTGHSIGLDVHESPSLSPKSEEALEKDMVFTVEPGIYVAGGFGVRFEDMVLMGKRGAKVLTGMRRDG